jgi:uncharacterized membrane protein
MERFGRGVAGLALLLLPLAALAQNAAKGEYTEVRLVVTDAEKGTPVPKAAITLHFIRGKSFLGKKDRADWDVKSDSKGNVTVPIPAGKLKVQVYAKGYQTYGEEVEVSGEEKVIEVKLLHPQDQYSAHDGKDGKPPDK